VIALAETGAKIRQWIVETPLTTVLITILHDYHLVESKC
jgi:hypothetical protein